MKRFFILSVVIFLVFALLPATVVSAPKTVVLKMAIYQPATHEFTRYYKSTMPEVERITNGRVKVKIYDSSTLLRSTGMAAGVNDGIADMGLDYFAMQAKNIPLVALSDLASVWRDAKGVDEANDNGIMALYEQAYNEGGLNNVKFIGLANISFWYLATTEKEIHVPSDLKGVKIAAAGANQVAAVDVWGGTGMYIPIVERYESVQRGIAGGVTGFTSNFVSWKFMEPCNYMLDWGVGCGPIALILNKNSLKNKVPKDLQEPLLGILRLIALGHRGAMAANAQYAKEVIMPAHMKYYKPTPEELQLWLDASKPLVNEWLSKTGELGQKAMEIVKKYNAR